MNEGAPLERISGPAGAALDASGAPQVRSSGSWFQRLSAVLFIIFCLELGLFLMIYPWISAWSDNYFAWAVPQGLQKSWNLAWNNPFVRGAVSGLGLIDVCIALGETFRLFVRR